MKHAHSRLAAVALLAALLAACGSSLRPTRFTNDRFDFGFVQRVAVVPFDNLSNDRAAGSRATRLLITELLASGAVDVVEPGEVQAALDKLGSRITAPTTEQVMALGTALEVQAVLIGTVTQSEVQRSGTVERPVVALDVHMLETETGAAVWAASHTEKANSLGARILGTGGAAISETTRRCVRRVLATLVE